MTISHLALLCLSSDGCHVPGKQVPMARLIREAAIATLWPAVADDAIAVQALVLVCNAHSEAIWWILNGREVKSLIADAMGRLLTLRKRAAEQQTNST